jgi:hypothetical protein
MLDKKMPIILQKCFPKNIGFARLLPKIAHFQTCIVSFKIERDILLFYASVKQRRHTCLTASHKRKTQCMAEFIRPKFGVLKWLFCRKHLPKA